MTAYANSGIKERDEVIENLIEELEFMNEKIIKVMVIRDCNELESAVKTMQNYLDMYYDLDKTLQSQLNLVIEDCENLVERYKRITEVW